MDKLQLAEDILKEYIKTGRAATLEQVKDIFDIVDNFEKEANIRGYLDTVVCPKCAEKVNIIDFGGSYRVQCKCIKAIGKTREEAYKDWSSQI